MLELADERGCFSVCRSQASQNACWGWGCWPGVLIDTSCMTCLCLTAYAMAANLDAFTFALLVASQTQGAQSGHEVRVRLLAPCFLKKDEAGQGAN